MPNPAIRDRNKATLNVRMMEVEQPIENPERDQEILPIGAVAISGGSPGNERGR